MTAGGDVLKTETASDVPVTVAPRIGAFQNVALATRMERTVGLLLIAARPIGALQIDSFRIESLQIDIPRIDILRNGNLLIAGPPLIVAPLRAALQATVFQIVAQEIRSRVTAVLLSIVDPHSIGLQIAPQIVPLGIAPQWIAPPQTGSMTVVPPEGSFSDQRFSERRFKDSGSTDRRPSSDRRSTDRRSSDRSYGERRARFAERRGQGGSGGKSLSARLDDKPRGESSPHAAEAVADDLLWGRHATQAAFRGRKAHPIAFGAPLSCAVPRNSFSCSGMPNRPECWLRRSPGQGLASSPVALCTRALFCKLPQLKPLTLMIW